MRDTDDELAVQTSAVSNATAAARGLERFTARSVDGTQLTGYRAGNSSSAVCLIVNAFGMDVAAIAPLVLQLAQDFNVITWDCRVLPGDGTEQTDVRFAAHIDDARSILQTCGVNRVSLVAGWCTGARVALHLTAESSLKIESLLLVNGAFRYAGAPLTTFSSALLPVLQWVSRKPHMAASLAQSWVQRNQQSAASTKLTSYLHATDSQLVNVTSRPFKDGESLLRYAWLCLAPSGPDDLIAARATQIPCVVLTGAGDIVAAPEASAEIAAAMPKARLVRFDDADHYIPYLHSERAAIEVTSLHRSAAIGIDTVQPRFKVVRSDSGDMSIVQESRENPPGWRDAGFEGTHSQCIDHVERAWSMARACRPSDQATPKP